MDLFSLTQGSSPLLISVPHAGLEIPSDIKGRLTDKGKACVDADWHVDRLYRPFTDLGASLISANYSRAVVDLNRTRDGKSLYPGQAVTSLCPIDTFDGQPLYLADQEPDAAEIEERAIAYWEPYHAALADELDRLSGLHDHVVLWDGHSINNHIPRLFEGQLPDFNFGTNDGVTCRAGLGEGLLEHVQADGTYPCVLNGRFKGGAITRGFGAPEDGVSAVQLEMAQDCYMDQETFAWDEGKAARVQAVLRSLLETLC